MGSLLTAIMKKVNKNEIGRTFQGRNTQKPLTPLKDAILAGHQGPRRSQGLFLDDGGIGKSRTIREGEKELPLVNVVLLPCRLFGSETVEGNALVRICRPCDSPHVVLVLAVHLGVSPPLHSHNAIRVMKSIPASLLQNGRVGVQSPTRITTEKQGRETNMNSSSWTSSSKHFLHRRPLCCFFSGCITE